jgi:hypothetical protein
LIECHDLGLLRAHGFIVPPLTALPLAFTLETHFSSIRAEFFDGLWMLPFWKLMTMDYSLLAFAADIDACVTLQVSGGMVIGCVGTGS